MPLSPVILENFSGLDFRTDRVGGGAVVAHNVQFLTPGVLRRRPFTRRFTASALSTDPGQIHAYDTGVLVNAGSTVRALDNNGTTVATSASSFVTANQVRYADFQSPTISHVLIVSGGAVRRWDKSGASFATPSFTGYTPSAVSHVGVTPWDNRAVYSEGTRLYFSDAGDPYTVDSTNYVDLVRGPVVGIRSWRDLFFVFTTQQFFVFYGTSTDSTGGPVFNFRAVESRGAPNGNQIVAHPTGVFFADGPRVYRTTGGIAEHMSAAIEPYLLLGDQVPNSPMDGSAVYPVPTFHAFGCDDRHIYISLSFLPYCLVYDVRGDTWTTSSMTTESAYFGSLPTRSSSFVGSYVFVGDLANDHVRLHSYVADLADGGDDDSVAVPAYYRTGWLDMGPAGTEKEIRSTFAHFTGTLSLAWNRDYEQTVPSGTQVSAGASIDSFDLSGLVYWNKWPPSRQAVHKAFRGSLFQLSITNSSSGFFELSRVVANVREVRSSGVQT